MSTTFHITVPKNKMSASQMREWLKRKYRHVVQIAASGPNWKFKVRK